MAWIYSKKMMEGYANSRYSQEQGAESLEENFLDGEQCVQLNGTHTHGACASLQCRTWIDCQRDKLGLTR